MRTKKILIVEDNPVTLDSLEFILRERGYDVESAGNGFGAFTRMAIRKPDLILLDLLMPGMDGVQFLRALREHPDYCEIPVLITSAAGLDVLQDARRRAHGLASILQKPFDVEQLETAMRDAVMKQQEKQPSPVTEKGS